jgi:hypothetical protein
MRELLSMNKLSIEHKVSSFDIINKLLYVMNNYNIKVNDFTIKKYIINITSDEKIKNKIISYV